MIKNKQNGCWWINKIVGKRNSLLCITYMGLEREEERRDYYGKELNKSYWLSSRRAMSEANYFVMDKS